MCRCHYRCTNAIANVQMPLQIRRCNFICTNATHHCCILQSLTTAVFCSPSPLRHSAVAQHYCILQSLTTDVFCGHLTLLYSEIAHHWCIMQSLTTAVFCSDYLFTILVYVYNYSRSQSIIWLLKIQHMCMFIQDLIIHVWLFKILE